MTRIGDLIIQGDPNKITKSEKSLVGLAQTQLTHFKHRQCEGQITRQRKTKNSEEKSIIFLVLVCDYIKYYFTEMLIDESRTHVLTKYITTKGKISKHYVCKI